METRENAMCPECLRGRLVHHMIDEAFEFDLGDDVIQVHAANVPVERCDQCGAELSGPAAAKVRHDAICKAAGFFSPEEIAALRTRLALAPEAFATLVGVDATTVLRWEKGRAIQSRSSDQVLFLLAKSEEARRLLSDRGSGAPVISPPLIASPTA